MSMGHLLCVFTLARYTYASLIITRYPTLIDLSTPNIANITPLYYIINRAN